MGEEITSGDRRLNQLEERFTRTEDKVMQLDKSIAVYSAIFERNLQIQEKLSTAIDRLTETTSGLQRTLIGVLQDIKRNAEAQEQNSMKIGEIEVATDKKINELETKLHGKLETLDVKLNTVDDKGKFDFIKFLKENFISVTMFVYIIVDGVKSYLQVAK
jgi:chromosome segregation ATPase